MQNFAEIKNIPYFLPVVYFELVNLHWDVNFPGSCFTVGWREGKVSLGTVSL